MMGKTSRLGHRCRYFGCWLLAAAGILLVLPRLPGYRWVRRQDGGRGAAAAGGGVTGVSFSVGTRGAVGREEEEAAHTAAHRRAHPQDQHSSSPASAALAGWRTVSASRWHHPLQHLTETAGRRQITSPKAPPGGHCRLHDHEDAKASSKERIPHQKFFENYRDVSREEAMNYEIIHIVGKGAYGTVVDAIEVRTGDLVAIKKMRGLSVSGRGWKNLQELKLLRLLGESEDIISVKNILLPSGNQTFNTAFLVMEKMDNTVKSMHTTIPQLGLFALFQMLRGLHYMHSVGVSHRDIKGDNILLNDKCKFKLIDFGISTLAPRGDLAPSVKEGMTRYHPPEMMLAKMTNWTHAMDVWSLGTVFVGMSTGKRIFSRFGPKRVMISIIQQLGTPPPQVLAKYPERLQDFIKTLPYHPPRSLSHNFPTLDKTSLRLATAMLDLDPETRPTTGQLLSDPIFASLHRGRPLPTRSVISQADLGVHPGMTELRMAYYEEAMLYHQKAPPIANTKGGLPDLQNIFLDFWWTLRARISSFARRWYRILAL